MSRLILLLRPQPGATASAEKARALGLEPVVAPLFIVRPLDWEPKDPAAFDALLLTSANAVRLAGPHLALYHGLPVHAVGEATADAARAAGFEDVSVGPAGVEVLLRGIRGNMHLLHLCGRDHIQMERKGVIHVPVYTSDAASQLPSDAAQALESGALALIHSPRAGAVFAKLVDDAGISRDTIRIAAISRAAAAAAGGGWQRVDTALGPRDEMLLALAARIATDKD
ncbi:uroporphyrinogen-III synthase [Allosphingosinicella vermicomposti]|uniref:uroporphyrinogen-III synthase n=1 Tax=Allosphingosinicella vermicomposti TaxID=614671 RepID=UPI000D0FE66D|nr:uroporphyrinogen-III synthase [Allosphingosinicella vermicomposti]